MKDLVLTVDCGTQGIRGIIFDPEGNVQAKVEKQFDGYYSKKPYYKEAPGNMFWDDLKVVTKTLAMNCPEYVSRLSGMTLAVQRDIATIVDAEGEPLRDFISWMDRRIVDTPVDIPLAWNMLFTLVGKRRFVAMFNQRTHAHWIKLNESELWKKSHKYVLLSTYLINRLTGKLVDAPSNIAGHLPFDYRRKKWCSSVAVLNQVIRIEPEKRCALTESCEVIGAITENASRETGLPVGLLLIASGTDKGCETLGVGATAPHIASVSLGTQATVEITSKRYFELMPFYPSFAAVDPAAWNPEVTIYEGFHMVNWFIDNFAAKERDICKRTGQSITDYLDRQLLRIPAGSNGLLLHPLWGKDSFRNEARGSIIGFTQNHDRFYIYRSIIEGLAYALREGIEKIEKHSRVKVTSVGLSGGGAQSDIIAQLMADVFGREVYRVQTPETTGLGGAMAVYTALGYYDSLKLAEKKMVHKTKRFQPDSTTSALYDTLYKKMYKKAYKHYRPLYKRLSKLDI